MMLKAATPGQWLQRVLDEFDTFLVDHAGCERKASATALTFVSHYPDRPELVSAMIQLAREELDHVRRGPAFYLMDRLLVAGVVEARGCERFGMVAEALPPGAVKELYDDLCRSEAHHHQLFIALARRYFAADEVADRLTELLEVEAKIIEQLPLRPALH